MRLHASISKAMGGIMPTDPRTIHRAPRDIMARAEPQVSK